MVAEQVVKTPFEAALEMRLDAAGYTLGERAYSDDFLGADRRPTSSGYFPACRRVAVGPFYEIEWACSLDRGVPLRDPIAALNEGLDGGSPRTEMITIRPGAAGIDEPALDVPFVFSYDRRRRLFFRGAYSFPNGIFSVDRHPLFDHLMPGISPPVEEEGLAQAVVDYVAGPEAALVRERLRSPVYARHISAMISGASALAEFTAFVMEQPYREASDFASALVEKYQLRESQAERLFSGARRVEKAKRVIERIKEKFGTDGDYLVGGHALFEHVFRKKPPKKLSVKHFPFAVGFYVPSSFIGRKVYGEVDNLDLMEHALAGETPDDSPNPLEALSFRVNKLFVEAEGAERDTELHEQKHILDIILGLSPNPAFYELSAYLFENGFDCWDPELEEESLANDVRVAAKAPRPTSSGSFPEQRHEAVSLARQLRPNVITRLLRGNMHEDLSFIASTTPPRVLQRRLVAMDHFSRMIDSGELHL